MISGLLNSLNFLVGPIWEIVIVAGGILTALAGAYFTIRKSGKQSEQNKNLKREMEAKQSNDEIIENARIARNDSESDILRSDDPQNRANE